METKNDVPVPSIHIDANSTRQLNLNDFRVFDANVVRFRGTNTATIARTHMLPDGIYSICVQALDFRTLAPLSGDAPTGCVSFEIRNTDAPILLAPACDAKIEPDKTPFIQFQWIPPVGVPPQVVYELNVVELQAKQEPEAAFRTSVLRPLISREVRSVSSLLLQSKELQLATGKRYAWRVRATDPSNATAFRNDGYSPACAFEFGTGDVVILKPKLKMPDTLICGSFAIVVQKWDDSSKSVDSRLPSGTGCIKFNCAKPVKSIPPWWKEVVLQPKYFDVVGSGISDSSTQLHITEAVHIDPMAKIGDKLALQLPSASNISKVSQIIDRNRLIDWLKTTLPLDCILVGFHDVQWAPPNIRTVVLTTGSAYYPTKPATPKAPAMLFLDSGFTLAMDSLILSPTEATVEGKLLLPKNIISADTCTRAFLKLPKTTITSNCEFYQEVIASDSAFGRWWLGNSSVMVHGSRYVIDFSSTQSPSGLSPALALNWKGVVLRSGETDSKPSASVISNRGYTKAAYGFTNATITTDGFDGDLRYLGGEWKYTTLEPFGYEVSITHGRIYIGNSEIVGGNFADGYVALPKAAIKAIGGTQIITSYEWLAVQNDMDLFGSLKFRSTLVWGEYSRTSGLPSYYQLEQNQEGNDSGSFYTSARQINPYYPADSVWHNPTLSPAATQMEAQGMQGFTIPQLRNRNFIIYTPDASITPYKRLIFVKETIGNGWMNIIRTGVHSEIDIMCDSARLGHKELGDSLRSRYEGERAFKTSFGICFDPRSKRPQTSLSHVDAAGIANNPKLFMPFQFCESAVWNSELAGEVTLPAPASINVAFKNMMFTSTAECAGGQVDMSKPDTLPYWGVSLVAKDSSKSAGIICARLGVIYLTAAGISEPRHYSKPFWLTWGELKADGNLGKMFFDYNSVGQRFDGFPFSPSLVRLSDYQATNSDTARVPGMTVGALGGFLHSYGTVSVHFFGGKMLSLSDYKLENNTSPYYGRWVRVQETSVLTAPASDTHWKRNWCGGIANFDYTSVVYDSTIQDGFFGTGTASLLEITGGMSSTITIRAERSCFSIVAEASHDINLSVVANFSAMEKIWGCGCIVGETLEKVVIGGEISHGSGVGASLLAREGSMLSIKLSFLPTQTKVSLQGDMYVLLATSINAEVSGMAELTEDHGIGYVEGYLKGTVQLSTFLTGVTAEGELQWHFGLDYQMVQGRVAVGVYGPVQLGLESGVFLGVNCPKDKIWVTDGINSRFSFNKGGLPTRLTGMYAFIDVSSSINLYIVSGGFETYVGIGAFQGSNPPIGYGFGLIGNVGVRIWGEILGGLVSASAYGDLQFIAGIPPAFEGSIGLEACVLWVFCGSVDVHCGYNHSDGFYMY